MTYDPNQPRQPAGSKTGGQWVKTPGGGKRAAGTWTRNRRERRKNLNMSAENTVAEDFRRAQKEQAERDEAERQRKAAEKFKQGKREAAKRFAEKQAAWKAKGLRPPAEVRKILRAKDAIEKQKMGVPPNRVNMGKEGVWEKVRSWAGGKTKRWEQRFVNLGEKSPGGKHRLKGVKSGVHEWEDAGPKLGDVSPGGKHKWTLGGAGIGAPHWKTIPPPETKGKVHARHKALREAKKLETFRARKNWAAKNLALRRKGLPELPHPTAEIPLGQLSPGGKFVRGNKRNKAGRVVLGKHGHRLGEWRLLPTKYRGQMGIMPKHLNTGQQSKTGDVPRGALGKLPSRHPAPLKAPAAGGRDPNKIQRTGAHIVSDDGNQAVTIVHDRRNKDGLFQKAFVQIDGDGQGILKTDGFTNRGWGFNAWDIKRGFARREVAAYEFSEMLGLGAVPKTVPFVADKNPLLPAHGGYHSLQTLVDNSNTAEHFSMDDVWNGLADQDDAGKMFLIDGVLGNYDRHEKNWLVAGQKGNYRLYAIDNGGILAMEADDAVSMRGSWICDIQNEIPGKLPLNIKYKHKLQEVISNGSLQRLIDDVTSATRGGPKQDRADAAMKRAQSMVDRWDEIFDS